MLALILVVFQVKSYRLVNVEVALGNNIVHKCFIRFALEYCHVINVT